MPASRSKIAAKAKNALKGAISIPKHTANDGDKDEDGAKTPKTPADEGIEFFEGFPADGERPIQVYELRLASDGGPTQDNSYLRLPPATTPYILRVSLEAGTPASKNGVFKTNFPIDGGVFGRKRFAERKLPTDFTKPIKIDLPISHAGAFTYWVEYDGDDGNRIKGREGYFNIDPILRARKRTPIVASNGPFVDSLTAGGGAITEEEVHVPLDGLAIITVISKWMGPLANWGPHFAEASSRGYNMLHYTPLQQRGESDSPYSIADQASYDATLFEEGWKGSAKEGRQRIEAAFKVAREEHGLMSLTDVVLNHTAHNSAWLRDHPEAGFSPVNTPHLAPAFELDEAIVEFSGSVASRGLPVRINTPADLDTLINALKEDVKKLNIWQYYVLNTDNERTSVKAALESQDGPAWPADVAGKTVEELAHIFRDAGKIKNLGQLAGRFAVQSDSQAAAALVRAAFVELKGPDSVNQLTEAWIRIVDVLNVPLYAEWEADNHAAFDFIRNRVDYIRLADHGPKMGDISKASPLVEPYFTRLPVPAGADPAAYAVANNGWIWDADPLQNFALLPSKAYLRREVIAWGDCVKLRYGNGPEDNPWLWSFITSYVEELAATFDGFRIDNCHSTPLHVGIAMLDAARVVNPNLYVCAELFTGSEEMDRTFVSQLGINSLIREGYNAHDPKDLSRVIYRFGINKPIGSMDTACLTTQEELPPPTGKGPTRQCVVTPLRGSSPHALFFDLTHDNESPLDKRSAEDALSTGALITFACSASGTVKGFDDLYPKLLNLVAEKRTYALGEEGGFGKAKRVLNHLHTEMSLAGYTESHVHQENDYIVIHRVQPHTQKGYVLVAHTAFQKGSKDRGWINPIQLKRTKAKFIFGAYIDVSSYEPVKDSSQLHGLPSKLFELSSVDPKESSNDEGPYTEISPPSYFPPGSILLYSTQIEGLDADLDSFCGAGASEAFGDLDLVDLNVVLHRCDGEERDATNGEIGAYEIPGMGKNVYCGLEGWMHPLRHVMRHNDLGHSLCGHLREGTWAFDYIVDRLVKQASSMPNLAKPAAWFKERFDRIKATVPAFLRPKYFAIVIAEAYKAARRTVTEQCSEFVSAGHDFTQDLALCSVQMYGLVQSASLDPGKPVPSLAAGLPHFVAGWARTWGRDVFISLRGLFLATGNFDGARRHILAFASTLKHGLIPNLLDSVRNPRYNSRDSPWWMLQNIQDYTLKAPEGVAILDERIKRRFPKDDKWVAWNDAEAYSYESTLAEIVQEILQRHADGISFREHNAGPNLDMQMRDSGFDIQIKVDWETGLILGGSESNCGTWMDKMGESERAGTKGVPGTPRDGAPIEITGLLKSTLRWLGDLSSNGKFPFKGVDADIDGKRCVVTYKEWSDLLASTFEQCYYVPLDPSKDANYRVNPSIINRRGIYKDVYGSGSGREWSDYQFRPNFPIAMVVAPELFDEEHALGALKLADSVLRAPLGMRTLDPADSQYRPYYDNANDSTDASVAKGRNYHQGPEWGWPLGYFLRAYLYFDSRVGAGKQDVSQTLHHLHHILLRPREHIRQDPWAGLPELTNKDGAYCSDSCNTQAWSASTLLDFLEDVHAYST